MRFCVLQALLLLLVSTKSTAQIATPVITSISPTVTVNRVVYLGLDDNILNKWQGIGYAQPPKGTRRFRPPQPLVHRPKTTIRATKYSKACHQPDKSDTFAATQSEDCLYLDIVAPKLPLGSRVPVVVFIHGGSFKSGSGSRWTGEALVNASITRNKPIVYVAMNYRLAAYGFLPGADAQAKGYSNSGLLDQRAALQWVQSNIAGFGGHKDKVTIVGQSAGAVSVGIHLLSNAQNLYRAAFLMSGAASTLGIGGIEERQHLFNSLVQESGCDITDNPISCLENLDEQTFHRINTRVSTTSGYTFAPNLDALVVPDSPSKLIKAGEMAKVPLMLGNSLDEIRPRLLAETDATVSKVLQSLLPRPTVYEPEKLHNLIDLYSTDPADGSPYGTGNNTFQIGTRGKQAASIAGDLQYNAPRRWLANHASQGQAVFSYLYAQPSGNLAMGTPHGSDTSSWLGGNAPLSNTMTGYLLNFAHKRDPNSPELPVWPKYRNRDKLTLQLMSGNISFIPDTYRQEQIDYINNNPQAFLA